MQRGRAVKASIAWFRARAVSCRVRARGVCGAGGGCGRTRVWSRILKAKQTTAGKQPKTRCNEAGGQRGHDGQSPLRELKRITV